MLIGLFRFHRLLATSFLVVFLNVLAGQCYCATLCQLAAPATSQAAKPTPMAPGHACCRAAAAEVAAKLAVASPKKHPATPDDCCRKKVSSLIAAPTNQAAKVMVDAALLPAPADMAFRLALAGQWNRTAAVRLVSPQHLPPKIPDIRIFIQSLTV